MYPLFYIPASSLPFLMVPLKDFSQSHGITKQMFLDEMFSDDGEDHLMAWNHEEWYLQW